MKPLDRSRRQGDPLWPLPGPCRPGVQNQEGDAPQGSPEAAGDQPINGGSR